MDAPSRASENGVGADVTLQVHAAQPADIAQTGHVEPDDGAEEIRVTGELGDVIVRGRDVRGHALVPVLPVNGPVVLHPRTVSYAGVYRDPYTARLAARAKRPGRYGSSSAAGAPPVTSAVIRRPRCAPRVTPLWVTAT